MSELAFEVRKSKKIQEKLLKLSMTEDDWSEIKLVASILQVCLL